MAKNEKTRVHTQYKDKNGVLLPGVTTIIGILAKPALIAWAYNCGLKGIDYRKVRDESADTGSLAHYLLLCKFQGVTPDVTDYTPAQLDKANNSLKSFFAWSETNEIKPIFVEKPLISETYGFGGTLDLYGLRTKDNANILVDFKTGKALYAEYNIQCAAYGQLIYEATGKWPDKTLILRINTGANDDFEVKTVERIDKYFDLFRHLLRVYELQRDLR
jgi:hypothetical protein